MGDEIAKLKHSCAPWPNRSRSCRASPNLLRPGGVPRRGDAFITRTHDFTDDLGVSQKQLATVQRRWRDDTPEALNEALHEAVHASAGRAQAARMVLVADAPAAP